MSVYERSLTFRYDHSPFVILRGEIDGMRLISSTTSELVQKVSEPTLAVFQPGSTHPSAILFEALEQFDKKSPKADESIRTIKPDLGLAVDTCIEAAGREIEPYWQRRLLKVCIRVMFRWITAVADDRPPNSEERS